MALPFVAPVPRMDKTRLFVDENGDVLMVCCSDVFVYPDTGDAVTEHVVDLGDLSHKDVLRDYTFDLETKQLEPRTRPSAAFLSRMGEENKGRLRQQRKPMLEALDVQFMKNLESGVDNAAVVAEKQRLRDITKAVDACTSLAEMEAITCQSAV